MIDINDFRIEVSCVFKGETYSVRDNGAVMRHSKEGCRIRPLDNKWTFGTKNERNGYMFFASKIRVHQVVATAFYGPMKVDGMVVDHKDTNRCNNRAENLHWVTKLENVLNNPITRRRIINKCGSVEAFLDNPGLLRDSSADPNFTWMRTVSAEEAEMCKQNLERWSNEDVDFLSITHGEGLGEWVFNTPRSMEQSDFQYQKRAQTTQYEYSIIHEDEQLEKFKSLLVESLTANAMQNWKTPTEFPLCPCDIMSLETYYSTLEKDKVFSNNIYGINTVVNAAMSDDKQRLCVVSYNPQSIKPWFINYVYIYDGNYVHINGGSYFEENGALKQITLFQGKEWTGGDCIDDYC